MKLHENHNELTTARATRQGPAGGRSRLHHLLVTAALLTSSLASRGLGQDKPAGEDRPHRYQHPGVRDVPAEKAALARKWVDKVYGGRFVGDQLAARGGDYGEPTITTIADVACGAKYAMVYDPARKQFYIAAQYGQLLALSPDGKLLRRGRGFGKSGPHAGTQYPHLAVSADGVLHLAMTTVGPNKEGRDVYWDIHYMNSPDGGLTWRKLGGVILPDEPVPDDTGPTDRISRDNGSSWSDWAVASREFDNNYATGGAREITADGYVIGSFTERHGRRAPGVWFYQHNSGGHTSLFPPQKNLEWLRPFTAIGTTAAGDRRSGRFLTQALDPTVPGRPLVVRAHRRPLHLTGRRRHFEQGHG